MPSIHIHKSIEVAKAKGGFAGEDAAMPLWNMTKRELVEIAVRLGAANSGKCDSPEAGAKAAIKESEALARAGII